MLTDVLSPFSRHMHMHTKKKKKKKSENFSNTHKDTYIDSKEYLILSIFNSDLQEMLQNWVLSEQGNSQKLKRFWILVLIWYLMQN